MLFHILHGNWPKTVSINFGEIILTRGYGCFFKNVHIIRAWEDNIKMDLQEVGGGRGHRMELAQDRDGWRTLVGTVRNFRVP